MDFMFKVGDKVTVVQPNPFDEPETIMFTVGKVYIIQNVMIKSMPYQLENDRGRTWWVYPNFIKRAIRRPHFPKRLA